MTTYNIIYRQDTYVLRQSNQRGPQGATGPVMSLPANTIAGNNTGSTAVATGLTASQVRTLIDAQQQSDLLDALADGDTYAQTTDPYTAGTLWNDGGVLVFSTGDDMATITNPNGSLLGYGKPKIAHDLISTYNKVLVLSDSTWNRNLEPAHRLVYRQPRAKVAVKYESEPGLGGTFRSKGDSSSIATNMNYSPWGYADEYPMPATHASGSDWYIARCVDYIFTGPLTSTSPAPPVTPNAGCFTGSIITMSKTAGLRVKVDYLAGPHGDPEVNLYVVVVEGNSTYNVIGTGSNFSCYAATTSVQTQTVDIASWSGTGESIRVVVRGVSGASGTVGKYFIGLRASIETLDSAATNQYWDVIANGGEKVEDYFASTKFDTSCWSRTNARNYDAVFLAVGINGFATPTNLATWTANYQTLIDRVRGTNSTLPIILTNELRLATPHSGFTEALQGLVDDNTNTLLLNTMEMFPAYSMMFAGFTPAFQSGSFYYSGASAHTSNTYYSAKTDGVKSSAQSSDTTNWTGALTDLPHYTLASLIQNGELGDVVHPSRFGDRFYALRIWSAIESCATYYLGKGQ